MKILSIGNSFSQDAHKWLHSLAKQNGEAIETYNLYIGGCSLETHYENLINDTCSYDLEINGGSAERKISIGEAVKMQEWDIVTLQQVSQLSGLPDTYEPYLSYIADFIRSKSSKARICFHQTWAYETDSTHGSFASYDYNQEKMYESIKAATNTAAKQINAKIIPVGSVIQKLRENVSDFNYENGGLSLCRDGFHLSLDYGRYTAAAVWFVSLTQKPIRMQGFEDFDLKIIEKIINLVNKEPNDNE